MWIALVAMFGQPTRRVEADWRRACAEMVDAAYDPGQVAQRTTDLRCKFTRGTVSPPVLAKHWGSVPAPRPSLRDIRRRARAEPRESTTDADYNLEEA